MIKTETAISTYVKEAPDTGSPEYHRILDEIHATAPKAEWERLIVRSEQEAQRGQECAAG